MNLTSNRTSSRPRYHRADAHRGYMTPAMAVAGGSDTGTWSDSPARSEDCAAELKRFRDALRKKTGIKSRVRYGETSNVFCIKRWVVVPKADFPVAAQFAVEWLERYKDDTRIIHDAGQDELGYVHSPEMAAHWGLDS